MSSYEMQFIHRPLVQVKISGISVSVYPTPDALMTAAERAHGFHATKNNLLAANLAPRQVLTLWGSRPVKEPWLTERELVSYATSMNTGVIYGISPS